MKPNDYKEQANKPITDEKAYADCINQSHIFDNTLETILPQTALFDVVNKHFSDKSGKAKKAVIFGWDGTRADAITLLDSDSALHSIKKDGGLYLAFTGGIPEKKNTMQKTSTAPGWATFLTGQWGNKHRVKGNGGINIRQTFLKTVAKIGYKVKFNYIWLQHSITYIFERLCAKKSFYRLPNPERKGMDFMDVMLKDIMIADIKQDIDLGFGIFEGPDSFGHKYGFDKSCPEYLNAIKSCDNYAKEMMDVIKNRKSYVNEDWLYVIISDHGGLGTGHGDQTMECRTVFIDINKKI